MKKAIYLLLAAVGIFILAGCPTAPLGVDNTITEFGFKDVSPVTAEITGGAIEVTVPYETDVTALIATFASTGVSITADGAVQISGTTQHDFTNPVTYTVTAEDGSTFNFTVIVTVALNPAKSIDSFKFTTDDNPELVTDVESEIVGNEINLKIEYLEDISDIVKSLIPEYSITGACILNQNHYDYSDPVIYEVLAEDGTTAEYTVNVYITVTEAQLRAMIDSNDNVTMVDTSNIADMSSLFSGNTDFDQDISRWDVSNVTNMFSMFDQASVFNQYIGGWDVSHVTNMSSMFQLASAFNQDISGWDMSNVTITSGMFWNASSFNQDISGWNVGNVTLTDFMFLEASTFNQDISGWNVSNVTNMNRMFNNASAFKQDLSALDVDYTDDDRTAVSHDNFSTGWGGGTEPVWVP